LAREELIREHPTTVSVKKLQAPFYETTRPHTVPDSQSIGKRTSKHARDRNGREQTARASCQTQCNMPARNDAEPIKLIRG
jgi:hypothetical protein